MKTLYTRWLILILLTCGAIFCTDATFAQGLPFDTPTPDYVEQPQIFPPESPPTAEAKVVAGESLLPPPSSAKKEGGDDSENGKKSIFPEDWKRLLAMIGIVTGVVFILMFLMRKFRSDYPKAMPREIFEVLGKGMLGYHQQIYVFRCGNKLFLVAISSLGVEPIGEITDPVEVEFLTRTCRGEIVTRSMFTQSPAAPPSGAAPASASSTGSPASTGLDDAKTRTAFDDIYQQVVSQRKTGG